MLTIKLNDGTEVIFSTQQLGGAFEAQGPVTDKVKADLSDVSARCGQVLLETVSGVRDRLAAMTPSELEIEIGASISSEGTIIISSAKAEATIKIKATWKDLKK